MNRMTIQLIHQLWEKVFTNSFPVSAMPDSLSEALLAAQEGEITLNPPVDIGHRFRGKVDYDRASCIGCKLCIKVCPANAIEFLPEEKKVQIHNDRCCFCGQCVEICPVKCLSMSDEFLISSYERKEQITTDSGKPLPTEGPSEEHLPLSMKKTVYRIDRERCIGCTICAKNCPVHCITGTVKQPHIIDEEQCMGCGKCAEVCPKNAIDIQEIDVSAPVTLPSEGEGSPRAEKA